MEGATERDTERLGRIKNYLIRMNDNSIEKRVDYPLNYAAEHGIKTVDPTEALRFIDVFDSRLVETELNYIQWERDNKAN